MKQGSTESFIPAHLRNSAKKRIAAGVLVTSLVSGVTGFAMGQGFERNRQAESQSQNTDQEKATSAEKAAREDAIEAKVKAGELVQVLNATIVQQLKPSTDQEGGVVDTWLYERPFVIQKSVGEPVNFEDLSDFGDRFYIFAVDQNGDPKAVEQQFQDSMSIIWSGKGNITFNGIAREDQSASNPDRYILESIKEFQGTGKSAETLVIGRSHLAPASYKG